MRKIRRRQIIRWTIFIFTSCIIFYTSLKLLPSIHVIFMRESKFETRINNVIENDNRQLKTSLPGEDSSTRRQHLEADTWDNVQLPPFVDSVDPSGPGEGGAPVEVDEKNMSSAEKVRYKDGWTDNRFNLFASDMISIHRSLPDCRSDVCKQHVKNFNGTLPELSVVIIFHNEAWTPLLRSVHSVLSRTPADVLKEIILVDDNSTFDHLQAPLNKYFSSIPKVKIIRAKERVGLTRARLLGFEASVAPIVAFLDSHIECFPGWSESMLIRVSNNPKAVVFPVIENIDFTTFGMKCSESVYLCGGFNWRNMIFKWFYPPQHEMKFRKNGVELYRSPVMIGGLFAISREFFKELGTYDPDLGLWGGENIELSFKTWMCGGTLEMDGCSHVGHIFRMSSPIKDSSKDITRNSIRVAEVWMDDYKNYYYEMRNYRLVDPGNLTDRINLRQRLQCKSFGWYLKNVYPEKKVPHSMKYAGEVRSLAFPKCLDSNHGRENKPILHGCFGRGENQIWHMGAAAQILWDGLFLCVDQDKLVLQANECQPGGPQWEYRQDLTLYHIPTGQCLTAAAVEDTVSVTPCSNSTRQKWNFQERRTDLNFPMYS